MIMLRFVLPLIVKALKIRKKIFHSLEGTTLKKKVDISSYAWEVKPYGIRKSILRKRINEYYTLYFGENRRYG